MNQLQFEMILEIIKNGAPVMYESLANALNNLVNAYNELAKKANNEKEVKEIAENNATEGELGE